MNTQNHHQQPTTSSSYLACLISFIHFSSLTFHLDYLIPMLLLLISYFVQLSRLSARLRRVSHINFPLVSNRRPLWFLFELMLHFCCSLWSEKWVDLLHYQHYIYLINTHIHWLMPFLRVMGESCVCLFLLIKKLLRVEFWPKKIRHISKVQRMLICWEFSQSTLFFAMMKTPNAATKDDDNDPCRFAQWYKQKDKRNGTTTLKSTLMRVGKSGAIIIKSNRLLT